MSNIGKLSFQAFTRRLHGWRSLLFSGALFLSVCFFGLLIGGGVASELSGDAETIIAATPSSTSDFSASASTGSRSSLPAVRHDILGGWRTLCGAVRVRVGYDYGPVCGMFSSSPVVLSFSCFVRHNTPTASVRLRTVLNRSLPVRAGPLA